MLSEGPVCSYWQVMGRVVGTRVDIHWSWSSLVYLQWSGRGKRSSLVDLDRSWRRRRRSSMVGLDWRWSRMVDLHWRWSRFVDLDRSWRVIWLDWRSMVRLSRPVGLGWDRVTVERVVGFDWAVLVRSSMVRLGWWGEEEFVGSWGLSWYRHES